MSSIEPRSVAGEVSRTERALQFPVGAASPLWLLYAGAASAGIAYWWMTRWAKPVNLEALLGAGKAAATAAIEATAPAAEAVVQATEAAEESLEAVVEEVAEIVRYVEGQSPVHLVAVEPPQTEAAPEPVSAAPVAAEPVAAAPVKVLEPTEIIDPPAKPKPVRKAKPAKPSARG